jgi:yopX protein
MFLDKKFKAFLKGEDFRLIEIQSINFGESVIEYLDKQSNSIKERFSNIALCEYSAFIDTKGKEIAVGDIVKMNESLYEIELDKECFIMLPMNNIEEKEEEISYYLDSGICEIMGNKFENKDFYKKMCC